MDVDKSQKSTTLEVMVSRSETSLSELKNELKKIINIGKDYDENIASPIITLLRSKDPEMLTLVVKAIAELTKSEKNRVNYAVTEIVNLIVNLLSFEITSDRIELVKQCCRALGNICCECDEGRQIILKSDVGVLIEAAKKTKDDNGQLAELPVFFCKFMFNFALGSVEISERLVELGVMDFLRQLLERELQKDDMNDDLVHSAILLVCIIVEQNTEREIDNDMIKVILNILRDTANLDISDSCLDILHVQVEHDDVKTVLAREGAMELLMFRLELLVSWRAAGEMAADDAEVKALIKRGCDLLVIILTGDDAMNMLYNNGLGESYFGMIRWLDCTDYTLLTTAVLGIGNFARSDDCCIQMMQDKIYDKLLNLFEVYHSFSLRMSSEPDAVHPIDGTTVSKIQHALLSALRNLVVPAENKRLVAAAGRAAPIFIKALPKVEDRNVAYKLLSAVRMLVDGQEGVAKQVAQSPAALTAVVRWGREVEHAGAAGEAPRLLAWTIKHARSTPHCRYFIEVDGCVACLVNMLVSSHSVMQNEAILSLTLLAIAALPDVGDNLDTHSDMFKKQLTEAEIGKHVSVLVETNLAKMPVEVAENLLAFLDITTRSFDCTGEYVSTKVPASLKKLMDSRKDFSEDMQQCIKDLTGLMQENGTEQ